MSVRHLLRTIDAAEFKEWQLYHQLEPWDETRGDLRAAIVARTIANIWRGKDVEPYQLTDFMPDFDPAPEPEIDEDAMILAQQHFFESLVSGMGGTIKDGSL